MFDGFDNDCEFTTEDILANIKITVPLSKTMEEAITSMRDWAKYRARPATSQLNQTVIRGIEL